MIDLTKIKKESVKYMKYYVNERCISCGLCTSICPEVFSMGKEGFAIATDVAVSHHEIDQAEEAKDSCPVDAIETY